MSYSEVSVVDQSFRKSYKVIRSAAFSFTLLCFVSIFISASYPFVTYFTGISFFVAIGLFYGLKHIRKFQIVGSMKLSEKHVKVKLDKTAIFTTKKLKEINLKLADHHAGEKTGFFHSLTSHPGKENFLSFKMKDKTYVYGLFFENEKTINDFNQIIKVWRKKSISIQLIDKDHKNIEFK